MRNLPEFMLEELSFLLEMFWSHDEKMWVTQTEMGYVEKSGLIKYDFLGLKTLGDLNRVLKLVNGRHGTSYNLSNVPMDDANVLDMFVKGMTESVFQFSTPLATAILVQLKEIRNVLDLAMITSIARPGPLNMKMDQQFIRRNTGVEEVEYMHPSLKPILNQTYGILCYQEDIIKIAKQIGDFDNDSSVSIMKALSKKQLDKVLKYKDKFIPHAQEHGYSPEKALLLWELMQSFAEYGFNKSHAAAYACVSYLCMWFKAHYPAEWIAAVLEGADKDDFKILFPRWKDNIRKPDINRSKDSYMIDSDNMVVMPFSAINGVGTKAVESIAKGQPYKSFEDFYNRTDKRQVNKTTAVNLIFAGCFDSLKPEDTSENRWRKLLIIEFYKLKYAAKKPSKSEKETDDLFLKEVADMNRGKMLLKEVSLLNFTAFDYFEYYKDKMTDGARQKFGYEAIRPEEVQDFDSDSVVIVGGSIESIDIAPVKNPKSKIFGQEMVRIKLSNAGESIDVVIFPKTLQADDASSEKMIRQLTEYMPVIIKGKVNQFNGQLSIVYDSGWILI
jgi:DNA polymerase III alpha subunit